MSVECGRGRSYVGARMRRMGTQRILIFQIGSLGDTVIAMPCVPGDRAAAPGGWRVLLTNFPQSKMVPAEALLLP